MAKEEERHPDSKNSSRRGFLKQSALAVTARGSRLEAKSDPEPGTV